MNNSSCDLKRKIAEKNKLLKTLDNDYESNIGNIIRIKSELDKLLYVYYKSILYV